MTGTDTLSVVAAVQTVVTVGALILKDIFKSKKAQNAIDQSVTEIKHFTPAAVELGEKALNGVKTVFKEALQDPALAARIAPLEARMKAEEGKLKETALYHLASQALLGYRRVYSELTPDEIATVVQEVQSQFAKLGLGAVAEGEVTVALQEIEKRADTFVQSPLFQQTAALVATKAKLAAQAMPVTAPQPQTTQPAASTPEPTTTAN